MPFAFRESTIYVLYRRRGEARQWSKGEEKLHSHSIAARLVGPQRSSAQKYLRKEHKKYW